MFGCNTALTIRHCDIFALEMWHLMMIKAHKLHQGIGRLLFWQTFETKVLSNWVDREYFRREDFKLLSFSRSRVGLLKHRNWKISSAHELERRNKDFLITIQSSIMELFDWRCRHVDYFSIPISRRYCRHYTFRYFQLLPRGNLKNLITEQS